MVLSLINLDPLTRKHMLLEFDRDVAAGKLALSERLAPEGRVRYPSLLREAIEERDDAWLASRLEPLLIEEELRRTKAGPALAKVPSNASAVIAERDFNQYYIRAVCIRAMLEGFEKVEIYRAKEVAEPRESSEKLIGRTLDAARLLDDLRRRIVSIFGVPAGHGSGLSVKIASPAPFGDFARKRAAEEA